MNPLELLKCIHREDKKVPLAVGKLIPQIEQLVKVIVAKMKIGGRLFYIGAGTSGRLGILDASEIPPTYGLPHGKVIGIMAGGDKAIRKAVEFAEDDPLQGWIDLQHYKINKNDVVVGIAASGKTPYVLGALSECKRRKIVTACITCNENTPIALVSNFKLVAKTGPEFVTGSTRMKAGTAQKLILNMISTSSMILLGRVKGNKMVDMQLTNQKLVDRGIKMLMNELNLNYKLAANLLKKYGKVRTALQAAHKR